ncbi:hypothetical protein [Spiroplasma sp. SV19]|uniref:hypothetical protein n=1 Tax=Spiroplasma sp. SV19 TaxID=2570468 RepID=UPI0024B74F5B|nr:hypothetical protein [Spiroplasma sp. SV19]
MKEIYKQHNQRIDKHKIIKIFDKYYLSFILSGMFLTNLLISTVSVLYVTFKFNIFILLALDLVLLAIFGIYVILIMKLGNVNYCFKCGFCKRCHTKELWYLHELTKFK